MDLGDELRRVVRGRVTAMGDEGFDAACRPWNLAVEQPVAAVVDAEDAADVASLLRHARRAGLTVTVQPRGHGASGDVEGTVLLRTGKLGGVRLHAGRRLVRVGAGVSWGQVLAAAAPHGLIGLTGSSPAPSVVGHLLGGGLSWFSRRYGFAADSVRSFDVVDADGTPATVDADRDPELFWALRGGGGDFAVVTSVELELYDTPDLYGGRVMWPAERAAELLAAYRETTASAPPTLSVWFELLSLPDLPGVAPHMRGRTFAVIEAVGTGGTSESACLLEPLSSIGDRMSGGFGPVQLTQIGAITAERADPGFGLTRAELLTGLGPEVADTLLSRPVAPMLAVQLRHLGGALAAPQPGGGACGTITEPYLLRMLGTAPEPRIASAVARRQRELAEALREQVGGRKPFTYLAPGERAGDAFPAGVLERLRELKRARDPHGVLRSNYPVLA